MDDGFNTLDYDMVEEAAVADIAMEMPSSISRGADM
jgi:hypothetical protein